ncbi:expressed protein [Phakopsora pachyrhizi]|uniref:Expressed protein n=1 Tax=Phakopsora pachyrhizi TaxID=170000 RepID=A0AAV0AHT9_PHAPC|nr:expressed protein [Phakopsora pachyrhizi]
MTSFKGQVLSSSSSDWIQNDYNQPLSDQERGYLGDLKSEMMIPVLREFKDSMILDHEPNRSIESFSRLPDFKKLASITIKSCPAKYDRSIIRAAEFLFQDRSKNTPDDDSVEGQSSRRIDSEMIWLLDFNSGLPNIIFRYLHELSKVYETRRIINRLCCSDAAFELLSDWNDSIRKRTDV